MKKSLLLLALSAAFAGSAGAAVQTVYADHYSFSYDDSFWGLASGSSFVQSGDTFVFRNLGYVAAQHGLANGNAGADYADAVFSAISVHANAGYLIQSITSGARGQISTNINQGREGSSAHAVASTSSFWNWTDEGGFYSTTVITSQKGSMGTLGSNGAYDVAGVASLGGVQRADLSYYAIDGGVGAYGAGSNARVTHAASYFTVQVTAVPEPQSYAMLLAGLCVVGSLARRRTRRI